MCVGGGGHAPMDAEIAIGHRRAKAAKSERPMEAMSGDMRMWRPKRRRAKGPWKQREAASADGHAHVDSEVVLVLVLLLLLLLLVLLSFLCLCFLFLAFFLLLLFVVFHFFCRENQ